MSQAIETNLRTDKNVDCGADPIGSLVTMFVEMVQVGRIQRGQCPALRPVFLKPHGVTHGTFRIREDLPEEYRVGLFKGSAYPLWMRFSSDTLPTLGDYKSTVGVGLKLFDTPTPKIFGAPEDGTFDFILQNMEVFFVDTAEDMCAFTKASLIDGTVQEYLNAHPRTKQILDEMQKPVGSILASPYWSIMPFAFGPDHFVKYKLEPTLDVGPPAEQPADPTYLSADLRDRLSAGPARFRFCIQFRTNETTMPLDRATVPWPEDESPFVHVADVELPQQKITERGQAEYGENLSWNIWRVTEDHRPQGSIADARRVVYATSADTRRNVNGIPLGEPESPKQTEELAPCKDDVVVRAAIHPGIGIARVGDAKSDFFVGPEVTCPKPAKPVEYRDKADALKRQAARFRIYGYNAAGEAVRELTADNADIEWTIELADRKAQWYRFITAMDIPETSDLSVPRRNAAITGANRDRLAITPGPRSIAGVSRSGGADHVFGDGRFKDVTGIYLGELQTDGDGRLIVLGGHGVSKSPGGAPPFDPSDPDTFNNADDWYDDMSDGPVTARVTIDGRALPVENAWVMVAPPNYAPDVIGWRTMYDLLVDTYTECGWLPVPDETSFTRDVLPQLSRLSNLKWVNKGFATMFGKGGPMDFEDPGLISRLAHPPDTATGEDLWHELRMQILNAFRPADSEINEPRIWPWIYGDDFGGELFESSPRTMLSLPSIQQLHLQRWARGDFASDWNPDAKEPGTLEDVPLANQPAMLDKAALHFCLADAFHPGCEMTWPMRHATLYSAPFRIRHRPAGQSEPDYGGSLSSTVALGPTGPLHAQGSGDITRWMGLPWQGDTAYCRSGYDRTYDPYLPTFWPARVPNQVLTEEDYAIVVDPKKPREERRAAYNRRASWYRMIDEAPSIPKRMERMIATFGDQGIVEAREGVRDDPDFPAVIYVETLPERCKAALAEAVRLAAPTGPPSADDLWLQRSGWGTEEHLEAARNLRRRRR
jgi:hypothetical protein